MPKFFHLTTLTIECVHIPQLLFHNLARQTRSVTDLRVYTSNLDKAVLRSIANWTKLKELTMDKRNGSDVVQAIETTDLIRRLKHLSRLSMPPLGFNMTTNERTTRTPINNSTGNPIYIAYCHLSREISLWPSRCITLIHVLAGKMFRRIDPVSSNQLW